MSHLPLDARAILGYLNELGYRNITAEQLKEFLKDLRKLIKYEESIGINQHKDDYFESLYRKTTASFRAKIDKEKSAKHDKENFEVAVEHRDRQNRCHKQRGDSAAIRQQSSGEQMNRPQRGGGSGPMIERTSQHIQAGFVDWQMSVRSKSPSASGRSAEAPSSRGRIVERDRTTQERAVNGERIPPVVTRTTGRSRPFCQPEWQSVNSVYDKGRCRSVDRKPLGGSEDYDKQANAKCKELIAELGKLNVEQKGSGPGGCRPRSRSMQRDGSAATSTRTMTTDKSTCRTRKNRSDSPVSSGTMVRTLRAPRRKPAANDPVALYHYYQCEWKHFRKQIPTENMHHNLRWQIRNKLLNQQ